MFLTSITWEVRIAVIERVLMWLLSGPYSPQPKPIRQRRKRNAHHQTLGHTITLKCLIAASFDHHLA
jgi:hypothetical protein